LDRWKIIGRFSLAAAVVAAALIFSLFAISRYDSLIAEVRSDRTVQALAIKSAEQLAPAERTAALLELEITARRYEQARAAMLSKLWTRSMGFVTGMLIALLGAAFVLGELRIDPAEVSGGTESVKLAISSSSPGLILCALGIALIALSLSIEYRVDAKDVPVYYRPGAGLAEAPEDFNSTAAPTEAEVNNAEDELRKALGPGG
jgi:hypothetical protein